MKDKSRVVYLCICFFMLGAILSQQLENRRMKAILNTTFALHESSEINDGIIAYLRLKALEEGETEFLKESLKGEYERRKKQANRVSLEEYTEQIWPFELIGSPLEFLRSDIERINNPYPCEKKMVKLADEKSNCG